MDPVLLDTLYNIFVSVAEGTGAAIQDTAVSPYTKYGGDCCAAVFTPQGGLLAMGGRKQEYLGVLPSVVRAVLRIYPADTMKSGDAVITNDPFAGTARLTDICAVSPVFCQNKMLALVASVVRYPDTGWSIPGSGGGPAAGAYIGLEGMRIPPVRVMRKENLNDNIIRLLASNFRSGEKTINDLRAQIFAGIMAGGRIQRLADRYGWRKINTFMREIMELSGGRLRSVLAGWRREKHSFAGVLDDGGMAGDALIISGSVCNDGESLTVDFTGTHRQVEEPYNIPVGLTHSCVYHAVMTFAGRDIPFNEGFIRQIKVIAPDGSLVNAAFPAPVSLAGLATARHVAKGLYDCLTAIAPGGPEPQSGTASIVYFGAIGPDGGYSSLPDTSSRGRAGIIPVEVIERLCPVVVDSCELTGGPGGAVIKKSYTLTGEMLVSAYAGRGRLTVYRAGDPENNMAAGSNKFSGILPQGSKITLETSLD